MEMENVAPGDIEKRSFEIIRPQIHRTDLTDAEMQVLMRVIHTTADFDYEQNLVFTKDAVPKAMELLRAGTDIVTDTAMAAAGIHTASLLRLGGHVLNFMHDEDVAAKAKAEGTTRAAISMRKAAELGRPFLFAIGNAPTALIELCRLMQEGYRPAFIIGVPVGFVNAEQSKQLLLETDADCIAARGRKGGSNVAAAICNALLYQVTER